MITKVNGRRAASAMARTREEMNNSTSLGGRRLNNTTLMADGGDGDDFDAMDGQKIRRVIRVVRKSNSRNTRNKTQSYQSDQKHGISKLLLPPELITMND